MAEKSLYVYLIINIIIFCCNLAFTIGGSIALDQNNSQSDSSETFFDVWLSNIILTIISGIQSLYLLVTCCGLTQIDNDNKSSNNQIFEIINLGVSIWVLVIYYGGNTDISLLESSHYSLYMLLTFRVYYTISILSLVGLVIVMMILGLCCGCIYTICFEEKEEGIDEIDTNNLTFIDEVEGENKVSV